MKPEYDRIDLVFENCWTFKVSLDDVLSIRIDKITDRIFINAVGQFIQEKQCAKLVASFSQSIIHDRADGADNEETLIDHLYYKDLTGIVIVNGNEELYIHLPYKTKRNHSENTLMAWKIDEDGSLLVDVSKKLNAKKDNPL